MSSDDSNPPPSLSADERRHLKRIAIVAGVVIALAMANGMYSRIKARAELRDVTERATVLTVNVIHPELADDSSDLVLPGTVRAFTDAPIYARTNGYLKRWYVDIGQPVRAGQVLAELETPEVDAQMRQAQADLGMAQANFKLAKATADRWHSLLATGVVAKQDVEEKLGDADAKQAQMESARANVLRLQELQGFKRIVAPFDGIITARGTDVGALIAAGNSNGAELFHVAAIKKLRVHVPVPQRYASSIQAGMKATLTVTDRPGKTYQAIVTHTANAIDDASHTLLIELAMDNPGELLPGAYAEVRLSLADKVNTLRLPTNALLLRADGLQAATVNEQNQVVMKTVQAGRDFGKSMEIVAGLDAQDRVILNPPDSVTDGITVNISPAATTPATKP